MSRILKDWKRGDVVTAADLQALSDAVAMLECGAVPQGAVQGGQCRPVNEGPESWPWQVYAVATESGYKLRVMPGRVLVGYDADGAQFLELPADADGKVAGYDAANAEPQTVYLVLTGSVTVRQMTEREMMPGVTDATDREMPQQHTALTDAALTLTCTPPENALRVWPLAVMVRDFAQPLTQLQWGELSALEVRGLMDADGMPVLPTDRSAAAAWGSDEHREGMATLCAVDDGELSACLDTDGAVEFYLGPYDAGGDDPDPDEPPPDEPLPDDPDPEPDPWPVPDPQPVPPDPDPDPDKPTRVRYGYVAGEGFLRCDLVRLQDGKLYWELVQDPDFLAQICRNLRAPAQVTYTANGTSAGTRATVEMGLGTTAAACTGQQLSGTAQLVFHGTNATDASKKVEVRQFVWTASPVWQQPQTWYLSPTQLAKAGRFVQLDKGTPTSPGFVQAQVWHRIRIDKAAFRAAAQATFRQELAAVSVSGDDVSVSADTQVTATLHGSALQMRFSLILSDI